MADMGAPLAKHAHTWARDPLDYYVEPQWCADLLFKNEPFQGQIFDPACGSGNICKAAVDAGFVDVAGTDVVKRGRAQGWIWMGKLDFLIEKLPFWVAGTENIVTNPPFYRAVGTESFARRAIEVVSRKVAIFASLPFLASQRRAKGLFKDHPPTRVWILADRPSCPPGKWIEEGGKAAGGTADWCWIVWDKRAPKGETCLKWIGKGAE